MYIFGHTGITAGAVRAVDRDADLRLPIALSILPDLIDKPIALLCPALVNGNTRNFAHTLLGTIVVLAVLLARPRRPGKTLLLWACYAGHLVLDRMWLTDGPIILFWPFLGSFPRRTRWTPKTPHLLAYDLAGEAAGLLILVGLARRHRLFDRPRWNAFLRTGLLQDAEMSSS